MATRAGKKAPWSGQLGPGRMQRFAIDRARRVNTNVACGLAAYRQQWTGHSVDDAMDVAFRAAVEAGCTEVRYWLSNWIVGSQASKNRAVGRHPAERATSVPTP